MSERAAWSEIASRRLDDILLGCRAGMGFEVSVLNRIGRRRPALELEIPAPQPLSHPMIYRALLALVVVAAPLSAESAEASYTAAQRAAIRSMPITQRPYRPGHVYGNTVRALNRIRAF